MSVVNPSPLTDRQIKQIERALSDVGDYGEVQLVKEKGQLRFVRKVISESALPTPADFRREQSGQGR